MVLRYPGVVEAVAATLEPHRLCTYLYDLSNAYSAFYQMCPVLRAESDDLRGSRLRLCNLVRRIIADGLSLLGIEAPARM
jgi:arginyl-tRNA synthetase